MALSRGPGFEFSEAISLLVDCRTQAEVDHFWERIGAGGETGRCGWLKDRFGLSWQVVPSALGELMQSGDAEKAKRVRQAMLRVTKLEIAGLEAAYRGA